MPDKMKEIRNYWDQQAVITRNDESEDTLKIYDKEKNVFYHKSGGGTSKDLMLKGLETQALLRQLKAFSPQFTLEVGCGMGLMTMELAKLQEETVFLGTDYSDEMIANARSALQKLHGNITSRLSFEVADALDLTSKYKAGQFNVILTDRCLINLSEWELQKNAIREISNLLTTGGVFLMLEGSQQGLANLNSVRQNFGMEPIKTVWHNVFFDETELTSFTAPFFELKEMDSFCSTYMLVSRVLNHKLRDQDPEFDAPLNEMGAFLPNMGDYGYLKLYVFVKK